MIEICRRRRLRKPVEKAYKFLRMWCEPDTLANPDETNMDFMASESRDEINLLHRRPRQSRDVYPPGMATTENLDLWFRYLSELRSRL